MTFERFEKTIWTRGYGIVAFNHYILGGERYTFCAVLSRDGTKAFKAEGRSSATVFEDIIIQMDADEQEAPSD